MTPIDAFSPIYLQFQQVASTWYAILFDYAQQLFLMLATIEIGVGAIQWMLAGQSHDGLIMALLRKILWIGMMYAILLNAHDWIPAVISSFLQAGAAASGVQGLAPGEIFTQGVALSTAMLGNLMQWALLYKLPSTIAGMTAAFVVFFSFCAISFQMALTLMEAYLVCGAGVFLLGFGGFHGTVSIAEKYLSYVVGVGVKLFVISLVIGTGTQLVPIWNNMITTTGFLDSFAGMLSITGSVALYGVSCWLLPSLVSSMLHGAVGFGIQEAIGAVTMMSRLSAATVAAPAALASGGVAAAGIGVAAAKNSGGGLGGALKGLGTAGLAVGSQAIQASVPKLGRGMVNLAAERKNT